MCRLFAFKSVLESKIHQSLIDADNALIQQSEKHPDGWGVAYYVENSPHVIKSAQKAIEDKIFQKVSGVVTSHTVIAHIRNATLGENNILNTHPFQYGPWVFGHNGNIKDFSKHKEKLMKLVENRFKSFILGSTDSEVIFYILLSQILKSPDTSRAIFTAIESICQIVGPYETKDGAESENTFLSFILTDGKKMYAFNGGKTLHYTTHKQSCPERDSCAFFNSSCEKQSPNQSKVNHLIISSEPLKGDNVWTKIRPGELILTSGEMIFEKLKFT